MENPLCRRSDAMQPSSQAAASRLSITRFVVDPDQSRLPPHPRCLSPSRSSDSSASHDPDPNVSSRPSTTRRPTPKSASAALDSAAAASSSLSLSSSPLSIHSRKRSNKQAMLSPTFPVRRKPVQTNSEVVVYEGHLHAQEVIGSSNSADRNTSSVRNVMGWIRCRVVTRHDGVYLESRDPLVARGGSSALVINLRRARLEWESMQKENRFQLILDEDRAHPHQHPHPHPHHHQDILEAQQQQQQTRMVIHQVLIFEAPRANEYHEWVQTLCSSSLALASGCHGSPTCSPSSPSSPSSPESQKQLQVHDSHHQLHRSASHDPKHQQQQQEPLLLLLPPPPPPPPSPPQDQPQHQHKADSLHQAAVQQWTAVPSPINDLMVSNPPKKMHIILIRHGHYINAHARNVCDAQQVLSLLGRQQAVLTGKYLTQLYSKTPFREEITIYHSDMARAVQTAKIIGKRLGDDCFALSESSLLREAWPGTPYSKESHTVVNAKQAQISMELEQLDRERMQKAYATFFALNKPEEWDDRFRVIVCHANLIRYFLCRAMGIDVAGAWGHFEINHCGVTRIDLCENRPVKILSVNETGHLPHNLITSSEDHL